MKELKSILIKEEAFVKIIKATCDICGSNCIKQDEFEGMELRANWGYNSKKDTETWTAQICENCVDKHFSSLIRFKKSNF